MKEKQTHNKHEKIHNFRSLNKEFENGQTSYRGLSYENFCYSLNETCKIPIINFQTCTWVCGLAVVSAAMQHREMGRELNRASLSSVLISRLDGSHSSLDVLVAHVD